MRTVGISLAAPAATAACVIDWGSNSNQAEIVSWFEDLDDEHLIEFMCDPCVSKVGIDAPFGWPIDIIDPIDTFYDQGRSQSDRSNARATEKSLWYQFREVDQSLWFNRRSWRKRFHQARRCAVLLNSYSQECGIEIDRTGEGRCAEVYPGAALVRWGIRFHGVLKDYYRNPIKDKAVETQHIVMDALKERVDPVLVLPEASMDYCINMVRGGSRIDALVAALTARSLAVGNCEPIPSDSQSLAEAEGWVRVPKGPDLSTDLTARS